MKASVGDYVRVTQNNKAYEGILMPDSDLDKDIIIIKLKSGYNMGFSAKKAKVQFVKKGTPTKFPTLKPKEKRGLPDIALVTTGGTITSKVDYKTGAVFPMEDPKELLASIPELIDIANIHIASPLRILSEDMTAHEWSKLAKEVAKQLNKNKGVIVTHGTDTLHFTSAALSFALRDLGKPVAVVGGQRSSDRGSFDGAINLICGAHYCKSDIAEVAIVMHATPEDTYCLANPGTKVRKMHTSRRDTFRPINTEPIAKIWPDGKIKHTKPDYNKRHNRKVTLKADFSEKAALIKAYPGAPPSIIDHYVSRGYKGIIIEATGLGHVPTEPKRKEHSWLPAIKEAINNNVFVGFAPQCLYGRLDMNVYRNGRLMIQAGATPLEDMLPETAYVKLSWVLGQTKSPAKIKELMLTNIAGELAKCIPLNSFLY